jgi:tetratricopeptide (TPR) repeat protein
LELCALLAPDEIPLPLLLSNPRLLREPLAAAVADQVRQGEVVGVLYRQGLLTVDTADAARMHRLVQAVTLAHLPEADRKQRVADAVELLGRLFPYAGEDPREWPRCAQLLAHAQAVLDHAHVMQLTSPAVSELLTRTGRYLGGRGLNARLAVELHERALAIRQQLHDGDHRSIADSLTLLAGDLRVLGEYRRARELDEQALAMYRRLYEGDHPSVASSLSNLANDLAVLEDYDGARELHEQALAMDQRLYEGDHPSVATSLGNLGTDWTALGQYGRARKLHEQALAMRQRLYEGDHPEVASSLSNIAIDLRGLGQYGRARELHEQALAMRQRLYEGDHPEVATSISHLAIDLRELGNPGPARELDEQARAMKERLAKQ